MQIRKALGIFAVSAAIGAFALDVALHIHNGQAADTYTNVYGWAIQWSTAAVFIAVLIVVIPAAFIVRWWQLRQRARLEGCTVGEVVKKLKDPDKEW